MEKRPSLWVSFIPIVALVAILTVAIKLFGSDALSGATQVALFAGTAICSAIALLAYRIPWKTLEDSICNNIRHVGSGIVILLLIGAIAGTWMVSGIVPTFIYYGLQILSPTFFLLTTSIICAVVSVMTGSSWTTIATIGVALMGVGKAMGLPEGWVAGAIISGAYFGDKLSLLSDTTVLASSTVRNTLSLICSSSLLGIGTSSTGFLLTSSAIRASSKTICITVLCFLRAS